MSNWFDKPTKINSLNQNIDYIMCIDENGSSSNLTYILKQLTSDKIISEDDKYFTITGCIFKKDNYLSAKKAIETLKKKYWNNAVFYDTKLNKNKTICFHSREIRKHDNCFNDSIINYNEFIVELSETMKKINCKIISISINLYEYLKKRLYT